MGCGRWLAGKGIQPIQALRLGCLRPRRLLLLCLQPTPLAAAHSEPAADHMGMKVAAAAAAASLRLPLRAQQRVLNLCLLKGLGPQHAACTLAARLRPALCTRIGEVPGRAYLCTGAVDRQGTGGVRAVPANGVPCMLGAGLRKRLHWCFRNAASSPRAVHCHSRLCPASQVNPQPAPAAPS